MISSHMNSRCQVDLIDFQSQPDGNYTFILVYQDYLTKFVVLRPLQTNGTEEVAENLLDIFLLFGAPCILQSNNGREFCIKLIDDLKVTWPELKIVHGKLRHYQGSVESANQDIETLLKTWMQDNQSTSWSNGLKFIQFMKNRTFHSGIKMSPYEAMFGCTARVGLSTTAIPKEALNLLVDEDQLQNTLTAMNVCSQHEKQVIMEATSHKTSPNVLPTIARDEFNSSILNEPTYIEEEKKLFWNVDIKQEPNDLYFENNSSPIEQHVNTSPNLEECNVLVEKELNSDNKNELTKQYLQCSTIKKKKQRKLKKYNMKANSFRGIIVCEVCGNMFTKQVDFSWHLLTSHRLKGRKLYKTKIKQKQINNTKTKISCKTIPIDRNTVVKEEIEIVEHKLKEELQETDQLNNVDDFKSCFDENVINNHINADNCDTDEKTNLNEKEKPVMKCDFCANTFLHKSQLIVHMRLHTDEKPYKCEVCLKSFKFTYNLNLHMRCHTGEKPYECKICLKSFRRSDQVRKHMLCHTGEKPYKCDICLKSFSQKIQLTVHMRYHTGEKPFKCEICSKSFGEKRALDRHIIRCHTDEKSIKCEICSEAFGEKRALNRHMLCHKGLKPYKCEICLKSFGEKRTLKRHMHCHTGEKPFKCEICLKSFGEKRNLKRHMRCHAKEKTI